MLPVLFGALAVTFWGWRVYEERLLGMKELRSDIYRKAQAGCDRPGIAPSVDGANFEPIDRALPNAPGVEILKNEIANHDKKVAKVLVAAGTLIGRKAEVKAHISLMCNEVPRDGQPRVMKNVSSTSFDPRSF